MEGSKISRWWTWLTVRSQDPRARSMTTSCSHKASPSREACLVPHPQCTSPNQTWHLRCWVTQSQALLPLAIPAPRNSPLSKAASNTQVAHLICHLISHSPPPHFSALSHNQLLWWAGVQILSKIRASILSNFSNTITNSKNRIVLTVINRMNNQ